MPYENRKSRVFTNAELKILNRRLNKDYRDPHGVFPKTLKPKLQELENLDKKTIRKALKPGVRKKKQ